MSRDKYTEEQKISAVMACLENQVSRAEVSRKFGVSLRRLDEWIINYTENGTAALSKQEHNKVYPPEIKLQAVKDYLAGLGSQNIIAARYGLRSSTQLRDWIKWYNSGRIFDRRMSGGSRMKQGRETTQEERIAIAKECLENGCNYGETAIAHNVSYQQVYTWVRKYKQMGPAGLEDRRGTRTRQQNPRTELEAARIEIEQLKHKLYMAEMEKNLLKKLQELERGDAFRR